ncbi:MAG: enoyl-CoA hydratase/isomerase family protein, partial [Actinobacteria bacterium]|nr:enoyl-CoA hydratase/isomerase family protein [Actinomycetota bacterium]
MSETYDGFHVDRDAETGIATITLDVPEKMNRVSMVARDQLARLFGDLGADPSVRVIVVGGAGDKAFTAGGDIPGFMTRTPEELSHLAKNVGAAERCPKPVLAKLHGFTFGVGLELALA